MSKTGGITELFPWSAEARIIEFHINNPDTWHMRDEIGREAKIHPDTVLRKSEKLVKLKILDVTHTHKDTYNRTKIAWKLKVSPLTVQLMRIEKELMKA